MHQALMAIALALLPMSPLCTQDRYTQCYFVPAHGWYDIVYIHCYRYVLTLLAVSSAITSPGISCCCCPPYNSCRSTPWPSGFAAASPPPLFASSSSPRRSVGTDSCSTSFFLGVEAKARTRRNKKSTPHPQKTNTDKKTQGGGREGARL